jgi:Pregnancy-associated plasma protein-A
MKFLRPVLSLLFLIIFYSGLSAQERCGTVLYQKLKRATGKVIETDEQFEKSLAEKIRARRKNRAANLTTGTPYRIPVVVHIIHNGETVGVGRNISDAQVASQIDVLNKDFNRLNTDAVNTPSEFAAVAGNLNVEFVLAKQDPDHQYTDGIMRVNGNRTQWSLSRETEFKSLHPLPGNADNDYTGAWPSEDYLNIWVIDFNLIGYAQFPISSTLPGLEDENDNSLTDGVIVDYRAFGTTDAGAFELDPQYNKGRSATHEIGHFLGLRHVWGDEDFGQDDCEASDYADDTPNQAIETYHTPNHPLADECSLAIMFQNYMDYTDDIRMNLFTNNQVERMIIVLENSPRRKSLLTSHGLEEPVPGDIDVELTDITSPASVVCDATPEINFTINNPDGGLITTLSVKVSVNSLTKDTTFTNLTVSESAQFSIPFKNLKFPEPDNMLVTGENTIRVKAILINGKTDPDYSDNEKVLQVSALSDCNVFALYVDENNTPIITFGLAEAMPVAISLISMMGQEVASAQYVDIIDQTVPVPIPNRMKGVYIVRLQIGTKYYSRKVYIHP